MKRKIELLAPGGDVEAIKAAIVAGADAIYCGLDKFNARSRAENITFDNLQGIIRLAHAHGCEVFLTLNIIIVESELPAFIALLNRLVNTKIDGVIVQDLGVFYLLAKYFPSLKVHASTQLTTHNAGQVRFLGKLSATRMNLSRELSLEEIRELTSVGHENGVLSEVFVHGSNCVAFSGICYMSSVSGGNSGNRGRCSQPCREQYLTTAEGRDFPLNIKDNSAYSDLRELSEAGVDSVKIEGRIKKYHYVYTVVDSWRKQLQSFYEEGSLMAGEGELRKVFNRDFSNAFLKGGIGKSVFIDNPRDNSAIHRAAAIGSATDGALTSAKKDLTDLKVEIVTNVQELIKDLSIDKAPLSISVSGKPGSCLQVAINTEDTSFVVHSDAVLVDAGASRDGGDAVENGNKGARQCLDQTLLLTRLKAINDTEYFIEKIDVDGLQDGLFIPFKELATIKSRILFRLNGEREIVPPVVVPQLKKKSYEKNVPSLSLLISSPDDLHLCDETDAEVYYELPNSLAGKVSEFAVLFSSDSRLIPWFPSVLIGEDYHAAVALIEQVRPERIVTNNTGLAYEACQRGIPWIAGPYLNLVNSFSLLCLKEIFNCSGAFVSNEISREQIRRVVRPDGFQLYYSIYHPIVLMTSRVCLFHQVTGCKKNIVDDACIKRCEKSSSVTNLRDISYLLKKSRGGYHTVYNSVNFLNTDIASDIPYLFSNYFIDLRGVKTNTTVDVDKLGVVRLFESYLEGNGESVEALHRHIHPSTNTQYKKGI
jgi:putative protease